VDQVADDEIVGAAAGVAGTGEEDASVADVSDAPGSDGTGEEREGQIGRPRDGEHGRRGRVRRFDEVEVGRCVVVSEGLGVEGADDGRWVGRSETDAAEERAVAGDAAVGLAGSGGADDAGPDVEAEEDVLHHRVGELPLRLIRGGRHGALLACCVSGVVGEGCGRRTLRAGRGWGGS
jgi:hypothetical protein